MLPLRYAFRWRVAGALLLVAVLISTLLPAFLLLPDLSISTFIKLDKWLHGLAFAFLAIWFCGQYPAHAWWAIAASLFVFGVVIEVCQYFTVHRSAEWQDLFADVVGIGVGLGVSAAGTGGWSLRFEQRLAARRQAQ